MVIAKFNGYDINDFIEIIMSYHGRCIVSVQQIVASDNIAEPLLAEFAAKGVFPISVTKCSSSDLTITTTNKFDMFMLDCMQGSFVKDIDEMRKTIQKVHEIKAYAYPKATNLRYSFPLSRKIAAYIKSYQSEQKLCDFDEDIWDFDTEQNIYNLATVNHQQSQNPIHKEDEHHYTRIPIHSPYLPLIYPKPTYGQVFWVDFGERYGAEMPYVRPAVVIQPNETDRGTILVVPLTSQINLESDQIINPTIRFTDINVVAYSIAGKKHLEKASQLLFAQMRAVDKSRLRQFLFTLDSQFLSSRVEQALKKLLFRQNVNHIRQCSKNVNRSTEITIDVKHLSEMQKQILNITKLSAYEKMKNTHLAEALKIKEFLIEAYGFDRNDAALELVIDSIRYTLHKTKDCYFNLNEFAKTQAGIYDIVVKTITNLVKKVFYKYPKLKVSEFITLVAKIIGGATNAHY